MIQLTTGDVLSADAQTLVNTVNCVGVMGKGVALAFKQRFPEMFRDYAERCREGLVRLGEPYLFRPLVEPWILNFPTKDHWRSVSRLSDIEAGLEYLASHLTQWGITSLAVPPLGCGQGGLDWPTVGPVLYRRLEKLAIPVILYAPEDTTAEQVSTEFLMEGGGRASTDPDSNIPAAWMALAVIIRKLERERYAAPVGRTSFQKLAYFATAASVPTGLEFEQRSYGPFANGLKSIQTRLINNGILAETKVGRMFEMHTGAAYRAVVHRRQHEIEPHIEAIERTADLMLRVDTKRAEAFASAHFAASLLAQSGNEPPTEAEVLEVVMRWKSRRRPPLAEEDVATAVRSLNMLGWLDVEFSETLPAHDDFSSAESAAA